METQNQETRVLHEVEFEGTLPEINIVETYNIDGDHLIVPKDSISKAIETFISTYGKTARGDVYVAVYAGENGAFAKYNLFKLNQLCSCNNGASPKPIGTGMSLEECISHIENHPPFNQIDKLKPHKIVENFDKKLKELEEAGNEYALVCYDCFNVVAGQKERDADFDMQKNSIVPHTCGYSRCIYCEKELSVKYFTKKEE